MDKYIQKYRIILIETTNDKNGDYVKAMNMIINHDVAEDFVVSTMKTHSVREMCDFVFKYDTILS